MFLMLLWVYILTGQAEKLAWTSIPKITGSIPTVVRLTFQHVGEDIHSE
jgi:hypothetical protein